MDWTQFTPELFRSPRHRSVDLESKGKYREAQRQVVNSAERLQAWRNNCEEELDLFEQMAAVSSLGFPHVDKIYRYIIHEVANERGLASYSFGPESSRYTVVYKKGSEPSQDLLEKWQGASERKSSSEEETVDASTTTSPAAST